MKVDTSLATVFNEKCGWENDYNIRSSVKAIRVFYKSHHPITSFVREANFIDS